MEIFPTIISTRRIVRNQFPLAEASPYRLAIIGEAPGVDEENHGVPFVGASGQHLDRELRNAGIDRHRCFIGNVCQVRPPGNKIEAFDWEGDEIQSGLKQLHEDLSQFNPNLCLLLGGTPLRSALGRKDKISLWRGSLFQSIAAGSPFFDRKCLPSLHPAGILLKFSGNVLLQFDLARARSESEGASLVLPQRELITTWNASQLCHAMDTWPSGLRCSVDIEGGLRHSHVNEAVKKDSKKRKYVGWRCVALAARPTKAFTISWWKFNNDPDSHARVLQSFARLMWRDNVPKVLQNSLYDNFVLSYSWGIPIRNVVEDTMLKGWEIYCEIRKGLSSQASIWTREPFWKDEEMYESTGENLATGCARDAAVTLEICSAQDGAFSMASKELAHYRANVQMLNPLLYMELRGILYDQENVSKKLEETKQEISLVAERLNALAGVELRGKLGALSPQRLAKILYEVKEYPPQYKKEEGRKTEKLTTDVDAILTLRKKLPSDEFLNDILKHRHLEGILETLSIRPDPDGRVRCGYNVVGTETGRLTCYTSPTGAGANLQTITESLRYNYIADPNHDFFQCDLAGADGWTVACHCHRLDDPTMLEDYVFGLKPAKILALLYEVGQEINTLDRDSLKNACRAVEKDSWIYFASKRVQHASNYGMGIPTMQTLIMKDSFKKSGDPIYMEHSDCRRLQELYFARYPGVRRWQQWAEAKLRADGALTSTSGHTRQFFGRRFGKEIHETVKQFLADEPQQNTTWATNLAMLNLWNDHSNRRTDGSLIVEPLHQVHDALCGQWPQDCRDESIAKMKSWFQNELTIAGIKITIPFEMGVGPSWGELKPIS